MKAIKDVAPGINAKVVVFGADQPEYTPLPAIVCDDGVVVTRWEASWAERLKILIGGSLWLSVLTAGNGLQPVKISAECPAKESEEVI